LTEQVKKVCVCWNRRKWRRKGVYRVCICFVLLSLSSLIHTREAEKRVEPTFLLDSVCGRDKLSIWFDSWFVCGSYSSPGQRRIEKTTQTDTLAGELFFYSFTSLLLMKKCWKLKTGSKFER
jgi:hypothetical protein